MGKKRAQKDRGYLTATEWKELGGYKDKKHLPFNRLPFHCCAITFTPFTDPVCTDDGTVYDIVNAVPYVRKFHRHPVKGTPLELSGLTKLNFHKNGGAYALLPSLPAAERGAKGVTEEQGVVGVCEPGAARGWVCGAQCAARDGWR